MTSSSPKCHISQCHHLGVGVGFPHVNLGGHRHLVCSSLLVYSSLPLCLCLSPIFLSLNQILASLIPLPQRTELKSIEHPLGHTVHLEDHSVPCFGIQLILVDIRLRSYMQRCLTGGTEAISGVYVAVLLFPVRL